MTISHQVWFPIWSKDMHRDTYFLYWRNSLFPGALLLCLWSGEGGKDSIDFFGAMNTSTILTLEGVQVPVLGGLMRLSG
jgi:hypothetical protein